MILPDRLNNHDDDDLQRRPHNPHYPYNMMCCLYIEIVTIYNDYKPFNSIV